jgi:hypothetical protein
MIPAAVKKRPLGLPAAPLAMAARGRLLGLDAGDWSMLLLGVIVSSLLLALV